jgi:hypothetical protein
MMHYQEDLEWWIISKPYLCAAIAVDKGGATPCVVDTAPILGWMKGGAWDENTRDYLERNGYGIQGPI